MTFDREAARARCEAATEALYRRDELIDPPTWGWEQISALHDLAEDLPAALDEIERLQAQVVMLRAALEMALRVVNSADCESWATTRPWDRCDCDKCTATRTIEQALDAPVAATAPKRLKALERVAEAAREYMSFYADKPGCPWYVKPLRAALDDLDELTTISGEGDK